MNSDKNGFDLLSVLYIVHKIALKVIPMILFTPVTVVIVVAWTLPFTRVVIMLGVDGPGELHCNLGSLSEKTISPSPLTCENQYALWRDKGRPHQAR